MKEFKKGSSRPQGEESLQEQIRKRITPELTYKKGSIVLKGARLESVTISNLREGDYLFDDEKWNYYFIGWGQFVVPEGGNSRPNSKTNHKDFEGYAILKDGKCEKICNVIIIKD